MHLQCAGYGTIAGGDANAHIGLEIGRENYRDNPDYAGVSWLDWAEQTNQERLVPDSLIQWTYYSMRASDFADGPNLPQGKGRSIPDHLSADQKAMPRFRRYELNLRDHYRTDHAGLLFTVSACATEETITHPQVHRDSARSRDQLSEDDPRAEIYSKLAEHRLQEWNTTTRQQVQLWQDPAYTAKRIEALEDLLVETMNVVHPPRIEEDIP